jgi:type IX secretion system PorP/SprF family membrane protein
MKSVFNLFLFLLFPLLGFSQDILFSQFYSNRLFTNPAFAGSSEGAVLNAANRNQWRSSVPSNSIMGNFNFSSLSMDLNICNKLYENSGFGMLFSNDMQGAGGLNTSQFGLIYSHRIPFKDKSSSVRFGLQYDFGSKSLDASKLLFSDQLDPFLGKQTQASAYPFQNLSITFNNFSAGVCLKLYTKLIRNIPQVFKNFESYNVGFAVHNLFEPNVGFVGTNAPLPRRYTAHFSAEPKISKNLTVEPIFRLVVQNNGYSYEGLVSTSPNLNSYDYGVFFGSGFKNVNSPINNTTTVLFHGGISWFSENLLFHRIVLNYDINVGGISNGNFRIWEFSYSITIPNQCNKGVKSQRGKLLRCAIR